MLLVTADATNVTTYFHLRLAATGADATGLTITNIDLQYVRSGAAPSTKADATALAATDSAHGDNQAIEIDATDAPGLYRVDWPDAAFAAGVDNVYLTVKVATAFTETLHCRIMSATRGLAGTALPAAAADAAGGLPISDAGGLDLDAQIGTDIDAILVDTGTTLQGELDGIQADTEDIQSRLPAALVGGRIDATVDGTGLEAGAAAVIADAVWDEAATGHTDAGKAGEQLWTDVDAILVDTGTTLQGEVDGIQADTEDIQARLPAALTGDGNIKADTLRVGGTLQTAGDIPGLVTTVDTVVDAIKAKTDSLTFTVASQVDANVQAINDVALTGDGDVTPWGPV
jgi:uncharacterized protein YoxC